jgi:cation diffusion facilitator family transporter
VSTSGGTRAIFAALLANVGIAITKFAAFLISGSSSMLAESVHSLADSGNQILLIVGGNKAKQRATADHPFGFGRERYVYAFVVSIVLFSVGGVFSLYEGVHKIQHPEDIDNAVVPIVVLLVAIVLEGFSLRTALHESAPHRVGMPLFTFIRRAKAPELPVLLLEDTAALTGLVLALAGVVLAVVTGDGVWDGVGTVGIGVLLVVVALILGGETKSLLIGEGASDGDVVAIQQALVAGHDVERVIHMKTLYLGPDELMVAAKIAVSAGTTVAQLSALIDAAEQRVRAAVPLARVIYLEPDVDRGVDPAGLPLGGTGGTRA